MKHVSNTTWERLKEESAVHLYDQLHHDAHVALAAVPTTETSPIEVQPLTES